MGSLSGMSSDGVFLWLGPVTWFPRQGLVPLAGIDSPKQGDSTGTCLTCPHAKGEGSLNPSLSPSRALTSLLTSLPVGSKCLHRISAL